METVTCGSCKAEVAADTVYCPNCARPVAAAPPLEESAPATEGAAPVPAPAPGDGKVRSCSAPGCGQPLAATDTVCGYCGEPVAGAEAASTLVFPWGTHTLREGETLELGREQPPFSGPLADYPNVGRAHARVVRTGDALLATDLDSTNRTFVDGRPLPPNAPTVLRRGQVLRLAASLEIEVR